MNLSLTFTSEVPDLGLTADSEHRIVGPNFLFVTFSSEILILVLQSQTGDLYPSSLVSVSQELGVMAFNPD